MGGDYNLGNTWFGRVARTILERVFPWMRSAPTPTPVGPPTVQGPLEAPRLQLGRAFGYGSEMVGGVSPSTFIETARAAGRGDVGAEAARAEQVRAAQAESAERRSRIDQLIREFTEGIEANRAAAGAGESEDQYKDEDYLNRYGVQFF